MKTFLHRLYCLIIAAGLSASLHASAADDARPTDPAQCAAIIANAARLACYDALFRKAPTGDPTAVRRAEAAAEDETRFGLTQRTSAGTERFKQLESLVVEISRYAADRPVLTLENGQRWYPIESADFDYFRSGDRITIRSAALGSFRATKAGRNHRVPIRRID